MVTKKNRWNCGVGFYDEYWCDVCGNVFTDETECIECETAHGPSEPIPIVAT